MELINYHKLVDREVATDLYADYNTNFEKISKFLAAK